jgi:exodeoxyribonuclease V alpha subunit
MQIVNNYGLTWKKIGQNGKIFEGDGIFNGDIGIIQNINTESYSLTVKFDDNRLCEYLAPDLNQLSLAYAISVHKAQGCEFETLVLALSGSNFMIMNRNLLYTGVTRAKKNIVIVGSTDALKKMVRNTRTTIRHSFLLDFLKEENSDNNPDALWLKMF